MAKDDDVSIFDELDSRLDDLFADDDDLFSEGSDLAFDDDMTTDPINDESSVADSANSETVQPLVSEATETENDSFFDSEKPLHNLKAIVLEMDWEISDENLERYLSEINRLIVRYKKDRPIYLFFRLHASIGEYMLSKKAHAHPEALKFLYSVYNSLEKALQKGISLLEKNKLILEEVQNFKKLKSKLFPEFYITENNINNTVADSDETSDNNSSDDKKEKPDTFDISDFPDEIQKGINEYIEKSIAEKIDSIKKEQSNT